MSLSSSKTTFDLLKETPCEQLSYFLLPRSGLKAIIAVHSTKLGPALGGCRIRNYETESEALDDVLRLAEGMTYKNALARLPLGGGKAVILANPDFQINRELAFKEFADCINRLNGSYITAQDMGTTDTDIENIRTGTRWVSGYSQSEGGSGNPSPWTALGVFTAINKLCPLLLGREDSKGLKVLVEGAGGVGESLIRLLVEGGMLPTVVEINAAKRNKLKDEFGDKVSIFVSKGDDDDSWLDSEFTVYSPCAVGQSVNKLSAKRLKCRIIAGAANNQLSEESIQGILAERNIFYAPDYVVNAGGVISIGGEYTDSGWQSEWVEERIKGIGEVVSKIYNRSIERKLWPDKIARELALEILEGS
jgi:leucine dehydrogenase